MKKLFMVLLLCLAVASCGIVEDGQTGLRKSLGSIKKTPLETGIHFAFPVIANIERFDIKIQEIKENAKVPSSEGLISTLDVSILYRLPSENVHKVRTTIGRNYSQTVIKPYLRDTIRGVASGYAVKSLYSDEGRKEISSKIKNIMIEKLNPRGIEVQDVLLIDVRLPGAFSNSIEAKLKTEQESLQKEFELIKAKKDAEIEIARANGIAKANEIIGASITENYLRYKFIEGLNDGNSEVIYVPTEAGLPILEARNK